MENLLKENLLAHRSFLQEKVRTLTADSPAVAALRRRLQELEAEQVKIQGALTKAIQEAEASTNIPGIRAKIQAIDTLLSSD